MIPGYNICAEKYINYYWFHFDSRCLILVIDKYEGVEFIEERLFLDPFQH